ncbi:MAG: AraC family transcriptional regulator [Lachnospiraceae bacterium]
MNLNILKDSSEFIYYNNPALPVYVRKGDLTSFTNMEALCHWHEDIEFLMPVKGHISYHVNGNTFFIDEGDAIFINSRQMHYGFSADSTDCEYICIVFNPISLFSIKEIQNHYVIPVLESNLSEFVIRADHSQQAQLLTEIKQIYSLYLPEEPAFELKVLSRLYCLWENLFQLFQPYFVPELSFTDTNLYILKKMLSFIYEHYDSKISLTDISKAGGVCKNKCCKIFRIYLNRTPNDYLNSYRLEKSMILLRDMHFSITEIAYSCGFSNPSYFSETFLKYKGCTPTEYRVNL